MPLITYTFIPTGGVIAPASSSITIITPNQMGSILLELSVDTLERYHAIVQANTESLSDTVTMSASGVDKILEPHLCEVK